MNGECIEKLSARVESLCRDEKAFLGKALPCLPCLDSPQTEGVVFNIQKFTVHDGPGIRTEIFLKGCTLRCDWCSNPESHLLEQQVGVYPSRCVGISKCGFCLASCQKLTDGALIAEADRVVGINREACVNCLKCQQICPSDALKLWGNKMTVEEVMKIVRSDMSFYKKSGGGVTISGGEALLQWRFTKMLLKCCKDEGIQTCVETALHISPEVLNEVIPYTDLFITDIKQMDSDIHREYTGFGNELIQKNLIRLGSSGKPIVLRLPIIPDVNDSIEHIDRVSDFIRNNLRDSVVQVQFLRFRRLGEEKYKSLGMTYKMGEVNIEREEFEGRIKALVKRMQEYGIPAVAGSTNKISFK